MKITKKIFNSDLYHRVVEHAYIWDCYNDEPAEGHTEALLEIIKQVAEEAYEQGKRDEQAESVDMNIRDGFKQFWNELLSN